MKKSILIALGMAVLLFIFGYLLSTVGHDHSKHGGDTGHHDVHMDNGEHEH